MSSAAQPDFTKSSSRSSRNARTLRAYMALRNQEIAQRVKDLREQRGNPPQPVVAAAVGVSLRTYQNWEGGDAKPEYRNLENLAAYFNVSEEYILTGTERPVPEGTPDLFPSPSVEARLSAIETTLGKILSLLEAPTEVPAPALDAEREALRLAQAKTQSEQDSQSQDQPGQVRR